jgi:hypothetical protein
MSVAVFMVMVMVMMIMVMLVVVVMVMVVIVMVIVVVVMMLMRIHDIFLANTVNKNIHMRTEYPAFAHGTGCDRYFIKAQIFCFFNECLLIVKQFVQSS